MHKKLFIYLVAVWCICLAVVVVPEWCNAEQLDNAMYTCEVDEDCTQLWKYNHEVSI